MNHRRGVALLGLVFVMSSQSPSHTQDRAVAVPDMKVLLQNDRGKTPIHNLIVELREPAK
jgi:hypothetical protein